MLEDIEKNNSSQIHNNNKKIILLVTDNIQHYQQEFNNHNINNYKIILVNWNVFLNFVKNIDHAKLENLELIILDISSSKEDPKIDQIPITAINEIKKIFYDNRIFFILSSESVMEQFVSRRICTKENIRICVQQFSIFDVIDLISITKMKERIYRLQLKDHNMSTYSTTEDKIKDAIKFLKIGIENNEATLLLLSSDIRHSYLESQMVLHGIDINKLKNDGLLKIAYSEEFYLSFEQKSNINDKQKVVAAVDNEEVYRKFSHLVDQLMENDGRKGLRVFAMMDCFFEYDLIDELVEYECVTPPIFRKPILGICVYDEKHLSQLSDDQTRRLVLNHSNVWL
jgi:hypothetical protein